VQFYAVLRAKWLNGSR